MTAVDRSEPDAVVAAHGLPGFVAHRPNRL
jgi:hypothetical protein